MFIEERLKKILKIVTEKNRLTVKEAKKILNVSEDTIRRDFDRLAHKNMVLRTHGGIMAHGSVLQETTFHERSIQFLQEKKLIAQKAAALIDNSEIIILDAGTTTIQITNYLNNFSNLTVLTNALNVAIETVKYPHISTVIIGGMVNNNTLSIMGPDSVNICKNYHTDKLFLSVSAISVEKGLMNPNRLESETKKALIEISNEVIVVTDSSKIGKTALHSFCKIDDISTLITDEKADTEFVDKLEKRGIEVIIAKSDS